MGDYLPPSLDTSIKLCYIVNAMEKEEKLNETKRKLIKHFIFVEGWRQADVGRLLNLSRQRINQIIRKQRWET